MRFLCAILLIFYTGAVLAQKRAVKQPFSISTAAKLNYYQEKEPGKQIHLFLQGEEKSIKELVEVLGGHYKYAFKEKHAVMVPAKHVKQLLNDPVVTGHRLNFSTGLPLSDTMLVHNNVLPLHNQEGILPKGFKGQDVIVGIIDTGIDFTHPDFQDENGNTRVLYLWDQANGVDDMPVYGYGHEWDSAAINAGSCTHVDPGAYYGHGTSVAALAAGNGLATGNYPGVAPESDIIFVATDFSATDWNQTVAEAIQYIFDKANALGRPCVINTSLGSYYGSHDGLDDAAQMIDGLIKAQSGRSVVASAGNAGGAADFHLSYDVVPTDTNFTWFQYNPSSSYLGYGAVFFELWADTSDFKNVKFAVGADKVSPNYEFRGRTSFDSIKNRLNMVVSEDINVGGNILGTVDTWAEVIGGQYFLQAHMYEPDSNQYNFRFMTTGSGTFDVWSTENPILDFSNMVREGETPDEATFPDIADYKFPDSTQSIVSSWTCLPSVITVGNYMNRTGFTDINNNFQSLGSTPVGEYYPTSSRGPNRLGDMKPNIIAPGNKALTAAPLSMLSTWTSTNPEVMAPDGLHRTSPGGTSSASPTVAGIVALLFERCPTLTYDEVMNLIQNSAKVDAQTGTVPNIEYGYGKADAYEAFKLPIYSPVLTSNGNIDTCLAMEVSTQNNYSNINWSTGVTTDTILVNDSAAYYAIVSDVNGCYDFTDTLLVDYNPLGNFDVAYTDTLLCVGETAGLSLSSGYSYYWNDGSTTANISVTDDGTFYATITESSTGCYELSDTIDIVFDKYLLGDFQIEYEDTIACVGEPVVLKLPSGYFYTWSDMSSDSILEAFVSDDYYATIFNAAGCIGYSDTIHTYYDPYLLGDFTIYQGDVVCSNDSAVLALPPGYTAYNWSDGQKQDTIYVTQVGEYYATIKNAAGCTGFSDTVEVSFYVSPPVPVINNINDTLLIAPFSNAYQWYLDDVLLPNDTLQNLNPSQDGNYSVEVFHANGCSEFSEVIYIDYISGISGMLNSRFFIYPNPTNGKFLISGLKGNEMILIYDITGRVIKKLSVYSDQLNVSILSKGTYIVEVYDSITNVYRSKVVVE